MLYGAFPRIAIGGLSGDSGKTLVSCGLLGSLKGRGFNVCAFKKGPDYIDAAWLSLASGKPARNLDTYLMGFHAVKESFLRNASKDAISVIEGNRGLFDGTDSNGTHSTVELAKLLKAPVIIILNVSKMSRTAAAMVLGCVKLDAEMKVAGVILNHVANERHARLAKEAIETITGFPVLGTIPKLSGQSVLPSRHLGLITPMEFEQSERFLREARKIIDDNLDVERIIEAANGAPALECDTIRAERLPEANVEEDGGKVRIAYFKDESFSFYYPENLEMLEAAGAELIPVSPTRDMLADDLDALYIGGGFPEVNLTGLTMNHEMLADVKRLAEDGFPIYAECGGLMYLARTIEWKGKEYPMSGVLPVTVCMCDKPQGHGYCEAVVENENPFFKMGTAMKGHEFHYSKIDDHDAELRTSFFLTRGVGCFDKRDGLTYKNVFASYLHLHALATPEWVNGMLNTARGHRSLKNNILLQSV